MNLAGRTTFDTDSVFGSCTYPKTPLGGAPDISGDILVGGQPLETYSASSVPDSVTGTGSDASCATPQPRTMNVVNNSKVFFNSKLPALSVGSSTSLGGVNRPLTGPYQHVNIVIGSNL